VSAHRLNDLQNYLTLGNIAERTTHQLIGDLQIVSMLLRHARIAAEEFRRCNVKASEVSSNVGVKRLCFVDFGLVHPLP
jgi:hypothetical protein